MLKLSGFYIALSLFACLLLAGCASASLPETVDTLYIQNKSNVVLRDVSLSMSKMGGIVSCDSIPPGEECSLGFRDREIQNNAIVVSWWQGGKIYCQNFSSDMIEPYTEGQPLRLYIDISDHGKIHVEME